jgi:hypothetical protein
MDNLYVAQQGKTTLVTGTAKRQQIGKEDVYLFESNNITTFKHLQADVKKLLTKHNIVFKKLIEISNLPFIGQVFVNIKLDGMLKISMVSKGVSFPSGAMDTISKKMGYAYYNDLDKEYFASGQIGGGKLSPATSNLKWQPGNHTVHQYMFARNY